MIGLLILASHIDLLFTWAQFSWSKIWNTKTKMLCGCSLAHTTSVQAFGLYDHRFSHLSIGPAGCYTVLTTKTTPSSKSMRVLKASWNNGRKFSAVMSRLIRTVTTAR
ncbi:hypothetical protein BDU57DRAFT_519591 [Ampelomyces quisqualis]|uniref:Secreted protein n=1 Tax=Ampelomyces quisqualis TaxID=50730 RepID=A0A6A5QGQ5_AMPQU|nr:hypothetical protein BDU57DRAFT_519591 [Ampelomyces quisqualis]